MEFAERLKDLRTKRGYSQYDLAKKLGVSKSTISMMEVGSRQPSIEMMETLCDFFNVSMDYLRGKEDVSFYYFTPDQSDLLMKLSADEELYSLVEKVVNGSSDQKKRLLQMAELMGIK